MVDELPFENQTNLVIYGKSFDLILSALIFSVLYALRSRIPIQKLAVKFVVFLFFPLFNSMFFQSSDFPDTVCSLLFKLGSLHLFYC